MSSSSPMGHMAMKCPQSMVKSVAMKGPCGLKTGTHRLPVQRLNHGHYDCWTSTRLEKNSGWLPEMRHSISALGKMDKTGLHRVRCFQVKMCSFYEPKFFHLLIPTEALTSRANVWFRFSCLTFLLGTPTALLYFYVSLALLLSLFLWECSKWISKSLYITHQHPRQLHLPYC